MQWYLSTTADIYIDLDADGNYQMKNSTVSAELAKQYGIGIELAEFCMGDSLNEQFTEVDIAVKHKLQISAAGVLHAPYNELFPCAIDRGAASLAEKRYSQAICIAQRYNIDKLVIHTGYAPNMYYESWFIEQSVRFWKRFLKNHPGKYTICLENVMETNPHTLCQLMQEMDEPCIRLCLDIGHAYRSSDYPLNRWLAELSPWISHFHIHNNYGKEDCHNSPEDGLIDIESFLLEANKLCPSASYTIESLNLRQSCEWLKTKNFI